MGRTIIKVHSSARAWFVELHANGTCSESPLGGGDSWQGEWGCDAAGRLVLSFGDYQLAVVGATDGAGRGLEFNAAELDATTRFEEFRVGVVAIGRRTQRAIKWVDEPRAFIVEFGRGGGGDPEDGGDAGRTGVEAPLFGGSAEETVDLAIEFDRGADFDVVTRDFNGIEYRASMTHTPGPRAIWNGVEHCTDWQGHPQRHTVALVWIDVPL